MTIKELKKMCDKEIKKGNGDLKIFISQDEEGNGFHELIYGLEPLKDMEPVAREYAVEAMGVGSENYEEYATLG